jgi:hypothetical protein
MHFAVAFKCLIICNCHFILTAGCNDTDLPAVRRTLGRSDRFHIESAHAHHAIRVMSTETRCENSLDGSSFSWLRGGPAGPWCTVEKPLYASSESPSSIDSSPYRYIVFALEQLLQPTLSCYYYRRNCWPPLSNAQMHQISCNRFIHHLNPTAYPVTGSIPTFLKRAASK